MAKVGTQKKSAGRGTEGKASGTRSTGRSSSSRRKETAREREERLRLEDLNKQQRMEEAARRKEISDEIILIVTVLVCIVLYLSYFGLCSKVGTAINWVIFGLLGGYLPYLFPVALFFLVAFMRSNPGNPLATKKSTFFTMALFFIAALIHIVSGCAEKYSILRSFSAGYRDKVGGGLFGALLSVPMNSLFGKIASIIILVALVLVCMLLITERSFLAAWKKHKKEQKDFYEEYAEYEEEQAAKRTSERNMQNMTLDQIQEENRKRRLVLVDAAPAEQSPDASFYEAPKKKGKKKKTFLDRLMENGGKPETETPESPEMVEVLPSKTQEPVISNSMASADSPESVPDYEAEMQRKFGVGESAGEKLSGLTITKNGSYEEDAEGTSAAGDYGKNVSAAEAKADKALNESKPAAASAESPEKAASGTSEAAAAPTPPVPEKPYIYPPLRLLNRPQGPAKNISNAELKETAAKLQTTLRSFGVNVTVTNISCGPTVTRYELQPEQGVKVSKITALADDIKLNLAAADIRIEAPIPGKAAVGIEVPNSENSTVMLRSLLESAEFQESKAKIAFAVGKDIGGSIIVTDIAKMPHLLIAGATGSGKSVCINTLIMSILFKYSPKEVRLIMIDPKVVELSVYNGIPHLWSPVVTDPKIASNTLNWAVQEMTKRYQYFAELGVRDMAGFNSKVKNASEPILDANGNPFDLLPHIVIIVDELADLMMVASGDVEDAICRLAQLARAAGIHLVIATQRPSVNVITGLIKANIPSRIAFSVSSSVDSRTILDQGGAEKLLGKGDMLFFPSGLPKPSRVQGAFVSDSEVSAVVDFLKSQNDSAEVNQELAAHVASVSEHGSSSHNADRDEYFEEAGRFIIEKDKASIGMLQRLYKIGFNRAARIMDQLSEAGVVGPEEGTKPRKILMTAEEFEQYLNG